MPSPRRAPHGPWALGPALREAQSQSHFTYRNNEAMAGGLGDQAGQLADAGFQGSVSILPVGPSASEQGKQAQNCHQFAWGSGMRAVPERGS